MEEDMMMPNVAPAPMMQETPMAPNLSEQMPAQTEEVTQAEMQEAQGALQQILQVIDMLIQQGLSAEEIAQFLEQYGISEDELEQAAQILGVDINQLLGGQQRMPMAQGGPSELALIPREAIDAANTAIGFRLFQNDDGSSEIYSPEQLENIIKVFYEQYERQLGEGNQAAAEVLNNQINKLDALKIRMNQSFSDPMMMAAGGPGVTDISKSMPQFDQFKINQFANQMQQGMSDNEPMMQDRSIENQIFTLQSQITNLMNDYNIAVNDQDFNTAQAIANQINNLDVAISQMQAQMPMGLGEKKN